MSALIRDRYGVDVEAPHAAAVAALDDAVQALVGLVGDPVAAAKEAATDPSLLLARCLVAYLHCYSGTRSGYAAAHAVLDNTPGPSAPRERAHLAAARSWADGDLGTAVRHLERALLRNPRDLLALKVAQDFYFSLGDQVSLRDVVARVMPAWPADSPGAGYVYGMYAFGLEECGDYRAAERFGRAALAANKRDAWAAHAVIHVFEMEGRQSDGLAFAADSAAGWGPSFFAVHNWWHTGLYHLELGQLPAALAVYDDRVAPQGLASPLGRLDAASLLWRLWLHGLEAGAGGAGDGAGRAGNRAWALADAFEPELHDSAHCFNDWHAVMALALAGRLAAAELLTAEVAAQARGTNRVAVERAGLDIMRGVTAFARGQYPLAVEFLSRIRRHASVIGGSHAQRDAIDLTLLAAAAAADAAAAPGISPAAHTPYDALVRAIVAERTARKPTAEHAARLVIDTARSRAAQAGSARPRGRSAGGGPPGGGPAGAPRVLVAKPEGNGHNPAEHACAGHDLAEHTPAAHQATAFDAAPDTLARPDGIRRADTILPTNARPR